VTFDRPDALGGSGEMEQLINHLSGLRRRMLLSVGIYGVFVSVALLLAVRGTVMKDESMLIWMAPLVLSMIVLPRSTAPARWPTQDTDEGQDRVDLIRAELRVLDTRLMLLRVGYVVIAAITVVGVARLFETV
jgi:hypothetical protein